MPSLANQQVLDHYIDQYALQEHLNPALLRCLRAYQFEPQEMICTAFTEQTHLYFLVKGKAQVSYYLPNGKRSIIMMIMPFEIVGDMEFFEDARFQMDVIAVEPSIFLGISKPDALHYGYDDPPFLRFIIRYLSNKLRVSGFHQLSYDLPLINRVAIYLLNQPLNGNTVHTESKTLLADLLGTTTRHLNRTINTLESDGVIRWQKQTVTILDRDTLKSYGEL